MNLLQFEHTINKWGRMQVPFLFIVDFEINDPIAIPLDKIPSDILYDINGVSNYKGSPNADVAPVLARTPFPFELYKKSFRFVYSHLERGDSYLTNLTIRSEVKTDSTMEDLFVASRAKYKMLIKEKFLVFSPEIFVQIKGNRIYSYPMKGTINASIPNASGILLNDPKELAEHVTIVDLIRNDLSQVAKNVYVSKFRYLDQIQTNRNTLFQVSSEIVGDLENNWKENFGSLLLRLLPAGSVSGAPKKKTVEIIQHAEGAKRGYYTGVFGIFDGKNVDSGVMIRFIEKDKGKLFYRSGGGITTQSNCEAEYQEAIDKIYVPLN
jgi:para-aminobenzoate synthetase component I